MKLLTQWKAFRAWQRAQETEPKAYHHTICHLELWDFPDGVNFLVDIPKAGIHAFYGVDGYNLALRECITFLQKQEVEE